MNGVYEKYDKRDKREKNRKEIGIFFYINENILKKQILTEKWTSL